MPSNNKKGHKGKLTLVILIILCGLAGLGYYCINMIIDGNKEAIVQNKLILASGIKTDKARYFIFKHYIKKRLLDLDSGMLVEVDDVLTQGYQQHLASEDPAQSKSLSKKRDVAKIKRRANWASIYLVFNDAGKLQRFILPIHGSGGLLGTMSAFVGINTDAQHIESLIYYEQYETPGRGGKIEGERWRKQWAGKSLFNDQGEMAIKIVNERPALENSKYEIDGVTGATMTSQAVQHSFDFWFGAQGYQPFLSNVQHKDKKLLLDLGL